MSRFSQVNSPHCSISIPANSNFEVEVTGFSFPEIDQLIEAGKEEEGTDPDDEFEPGFNGPTVSRLGDIWILGEHGILCGGCPRERELAAACRQRSRAGGNLRRALQRSEQGPHEASREALNQWPGSGVGRHAAADCTYCDLGSRARQAF